MVIIRTLRKDIYKALKVRGVAGSIFFWFSIFFSSLKRVLIRDKLKTSTAADNNKLDFDQKYGVDTGGYIRPSCMDVEDKSWIYGFGYQSIGNILDAELKKLQIDFEQFTFIDFGSGKGRAVLMAAMHPFKNVIGVEYSRELSEISKENLNKFPDDSIKCQSVNLICQNALVFKLPDEPLVLYFYNPFQSTIMKQVVDNVVTSYRGSPRRIIVMYFNPLYPESWDSVDFFNKTKSIKEICIYDTFSGSDMYP